MRKRVIFWAALLLAAALVSSACTSKAGAGSMTERDSDELYVDLPALVIDYTSDGFASIGGLTHMVVGNEEFPGGFNLGPNPGLRLGLATILYGLSFDPRWVQHFTASNIQHIQVNHGRDGIYLGVNGRQIPSLVWEEDSLVATADALSALGIGVSAVNKALPLVQQFDLGLVLRFPVAAGNEIIPLTGVEDSEAVERAKMAQAQFLRILGAPPTIELPILFHADGSWTMGEFSSIDLTVLTSTPLYALRFPPGVIANLMDAGVKSLGLQTDQAGIHISVNGNTLPYLSWENGEIQNALALSKQLGLLDSFSAFAPGGDLDSVLAMVENVLPIIQATNANIIIYMPGSGLGN